MIRAYTVIEHNSSLVHFIGEKLDEELLTLQENGWTIKNVEKVECETYDYKRGTFPNVMFVIIAEHKDCE